MQRSNRSRRSVGVLGFYDPFAGWGFGSRNSLISDIFDRDPFDDPFFTKPLPLGRHPSRVSVNENAQDQGGAHSGPLIEELDGDEGQLNAPHFKANQEPIVEYTDDDVKSGYSAHAQNSDICLKHESFPTLYRNPSQSYSYSSVSYGGPGGAYYTSSTTRRSGGDGLVQEEHEERDSRTGIETCWVIHGLQNKGHAVTRERKAGGANNYVEMLHNLAEDEKHEFDQMWTREADKYLPGWKKGVEHKHLESGSGKRRHANAALPSSKGSSWWWPWAKPA